MNLKELIKERIIESFPEISSEELQERIDYACEILKGIRK